MSSSASGSAACTSMKCAAAMARRRSRAVTRAVGDGRAPESCAKRAANRSATSSTPSHLRHRPQPAPAHPVPSAPRAVASCRSRAGARRAAARREAETTGTRLRPRDARACTCTRRPRGRSLPSRGSARDARDPRDSRSCPRARTTAKTWRAAPRTRGPPAGSAAILDDAESGAPLQDPGAHANISRRASRNQVSMPVRAGQRAAQLWAFSARC